MSIIYNGVIPLMIGNLSFIMYLKIQKKVKKSLQKIWLLLAVAEIMLDTYGCYTGLLKFT